MFSYSIIEGQIYILNLKKQPFLKKINNSYQFVKKASRKLNFNLDTWLSIMNLHSAF